MERAKLLELEPDLPEAYLTFMENYPDILRNTGDTASFELLDNLPAIIQANEQINNIDKLAEGNYFCIGISGCGDYYVIDLEESDPCVFFWDHETDVIDSSDEHGTIEQFAGNILELKQNISKTEKSSTKPWWKFW
ncbi:SMI1/KNR4 family protein [Aliikangiella coralliicola]|nr:SMI1/KNR4 family protein [Aliikangiella coralliicola]